MVVSGWTFKFSPNTIRSFCPIKYPAGKGWEWDYRHVHCPEQAGSLHKLFTFMQARAVRYMLMHGVVHWYMLESIYMTYDSLMVLFQIYLDNYPEHK